MYATLPPALHAAAARGFFGADETEWCLDTTEAHRLLTATHTLQLLPRLPSVTAVRLTGDDASGRTLHKVLACVARSTQLTALSIEDRHDNEYRPAAWLRQLMPLTRLQRLDVRGCGLASLALFDVTATIAQLRQLTALVLEGTELLSYTAVMELARALTALPMLSHLGLRNFLMSQIGLPAVWGALAGMPQLGSLDVGCTAGTEPQAAMRLMRGLAECAALTMLDLSDCLLEEGCYCVRALCNSCTQLLSLALDDNFGLGANGVCNIVSVPSLLGLTRLSLAYVGLTWHAHHDAQPWRPLCALTALQELRLQGDELGDAGASELAAYLSSLVRLRSLDISHCELTTSGALGAALWRLPRLLQLACCQAREMTEPFSVPADAHARGLKRMPFVPAY